MAEKPLYVPMMARNQSELLFQYFLKNLIRFETDQISRYNMENWTGERIILHFQSKNFPVSDKVVEFPEQRRSIRHLHTSNPSLFWAKPVEKSLML